MSQRFFLMESLSEQDGGLAGRLGATLHTRWALGEEAPPPTDSPTWLRGRSDLKGVWSRSLIGGNMEVISTWSPWWWVSAFSPAGM